MNAMRFWATTLCHGRPGARTRMRCTQNSLHADADANLTACPVDVATLKRDVRCRSDGGRERTGLTLRETGFSVCRCEGGGIGGSRSALRSVKRWSSTGDRQSEG